MTINFLQAAQAAGQATETQTGQNATTAVQADAAPAEQATSQQATTTTAEVPSKPASGDQEQPQGSMMPMIIMLVAMFVIMYFFMIRPQKKRQKQLQEMRNRLEPGNDVILASGIRGKIKDTNPEKSYMTIEIAKGVCIDVDRNYVFTELEQTIQR